MYPHLLKIQILMALLVAIGGYVLGNSIKDSEIVLFSLAGTLVAFVVVDRLNWVELSGWTANLVLVVILVFTMRDFIGGDSAAKLTSVAVLLSYLLVALCFQKKTPRLCWQILALSILQMLEAAIFNLNFEYGLFFVLYFFVATFALILQNDYTDWLQANRNNKRNSQNAKSIDLGNRLPASLLPALVLTKRQPSQNLLGVFKMLFPWLAGSIIFSFILFHSLPHSRQEWGEQNSSEFLVTGQSENVDLDVDGVVAITNKLILRARFQDLSTGETVPVVGMPYFRGMALSRFVVENDRTNWEAPYDHVFHWSYKSPRRFDNKLAKNNVRPVRIEVVIEPTADPLLYATTPVYRKTDGVSEVEFCRDLSALTRRKSKMANTISSYKYDLVTLLDSVNRPLKGFPYVSTDYLNNFPSMEINSPEYQLLTDFKSDRYPRLEKIAETIKEQGSSTSSLDIANRMLAHFSAANGYQYTTDYRNVPKDKQLDAVEDFVANHRSGHCTVYATALTLMLRSVGIPSRYVVGYYGGRYNNLTDSFVVNGRHAHAWVEAYIPPEHCTTSMFDTGVAAIKGGAWITLDPTPSTPDNTQASEALDLARSIWQDYVISPDHNKQGLSDANSILLATNKNSRFGEHLERFFKSLTANWLTQSSLVLFTIAILLYPIMRKPRRKTTNSIRKLSNPIQQFLANAISSVSPNLGDWVAGISSQRVAFYDKFEQIIESHSGLRKAPEQTQLEFADAASREILRQTRDALDAQQIKEIVQSVIAGFYQVRFSPIPLDKTAVADIENQIQNLADILKTSKF